MPLYVASFTATAVTAAQDCFEIAAPTTAPLNSTIGKRYRIRKVFLGQYTDFGDAAAEILSVQIIRGYTTAGSGGGTATPVPLAPGLGRAAECTTLINNTTVAQDGTAQVLHADMFNIQAGWWYTPPEDEMPWINGAAASRRLVVRITAPADSITMNGTLLFEEFV